MNRRAVTLPKPKSMVEWGMLILILKNMCSISDIIPAPNWLDNIFTILAVFAFSITIINKKYSWKTLFIHAVIAITFLISCINIHSTGIFITIITCMAVRNENLKKCIKFIFKYEVLFLVLHIMIAAILSMFGKHYFVLYHGYIRYSMGFKHPNVFSALLFNLIIMYVWLNYETLKAKGIVGLFIIELAGYYLARTRTSFFLFCIFIVLYLFVRNKTDNILMRIFATSIVPFMSCLTYFCIVTFEKGNILSRLLDNILTRRISLGSYAFNRLGLTFFGRDMRGFTTSWDSLYGFSGGGFTFDNVYSYLMINVGISVLLLLIVLFYKTARTTDVKNCLFLVVWALYSMTEIHGLSCYMCFILLLIVDNQTKVQKVNNEYSRIA